MDYKILTYKETLERLELWETNREANREEWLYKLENWRRGTVDNSSGDFFMECFKNKQDAIDYLDMVEGWENLAILSD